MRAKLSITIAVLTLLAIGIFITREIAHAAVQKREAGFQNIAAMYSRDLKAGTNRDEIEQYVRTHSAKPESDQQPLAADSNNFLVRLGERLSPWYCSREVVYLDIEFDAADKYRGTSLKPEFQDCL
jgi:hypothetical protein